MNSNDETIIWLNKGKIALLVIGSCVFVALGLWLLSFDAAAVRSGRSFRPFGNDPLIARVFGFAAVGFFGLCGLYGVKKLFDKRPGLIFNASGIVDNASGVAAGFIPWSEVVGSAVFEVSGQKTLIIEVADPLKYVERGGALRRKLNRANYKFSGSPVSISAHALDIDFPGLLSLFNRYVRQYGSAAHAPALVEPDEAPDAQFLNWSPGAVKGTLGAGGIGILVLSLSSLDMIFGLKPPFWAGFSASMLPAIIFFFAVPDTLPSRFVRPAQWFAVVWYLLAAVVSISLAAYRGMAGIDAFLAGFILLGAWPCVVAVRRLRAA